MIPGLSKSGTIAALAVGAFAALAGGWWGLLVLFAFFVPSTLLSRVGKARKRELIDIGKQGPRDWLQVLANGGVAAAVLAFSPAAFAGALAAASADTWATEIGTLARGAPRSILTFKPLARGLSGGVTWQGSIAQAGGALAVALPAAWRHPGFVLPVLIGGVAGSLIDSLLGATLQSLRWCPACARPCETNPHACGTATTMRRGFGWVDNDIVNFACTSTGAAVSAALYLFAAASAR